MCMLRSTLLTNGTYVKNATVLSLHFIVFSLQLASEFFSPKDVHSIFGLFYIRTNLQGCYIYTVHHTFI